MSGQKGKVYLGPNVSSSAHNRGCVVNGSGAMAAIIMNIIIIYIHCIVYTTSIYILVSLLLRKSLLPTNVSAMWCMISSYTVIRTCPIN